MSLHTSFEMPVGTHRRAYRSSPTAGAARGALALGVCASMIALAAVQSAPAAEAVSGAVSDAVAKVTGVAHSDNGRYVLRLEAGASHDAVSAAVQAIGGSVVAYQNALGTVVVNVPGKAADRLPGIAGVTSVAPDGQVKAQSLGFTPSGQPGSMTNVTDFTGAKEFWKAGYTGKNIDVAIIDTGVAPVSGLTDPAKVVVGPDLSFESQLDSTRFLDTYGHGTNMAGIIAGRETAQASGATYAADSTNFYGMAPDARLVSIKLADHGGAVDVTQMIAAIDWVVNNHNSNGMNIKVLNLSYGTMSKNDPASDPLSWASEVAWRSGVAVVASTGNDGDSVVGLASPAYNPWIIAVGAQDTKGTATYADDSVPSFSERSASGQRPPDLVAPGVGIVSLGVKGSNLYDGYSSARIGNGFMRGNGTSQAAAVVSGALALMLSKTPSTTPDDLKGTLLGNSTKLSGIDTSAQGQGALDLRKVLNSGTFGRGAYTLPPMLGTGTGTVEKTRGGQNLTMDGVALTGEKDIFGLNWDSSSLAGAVAQGRSWTWDGWFNGSQWTGGQFITNDTTSWAGKTWQGKTWQGKTWQGKTWQVGGWTGTGWSAAAWESASTVPSWAGRTWSSAGWN
jgi:serine protease AprX